MIKPWRWIDRSGPLYVGPRGGKWELVDGRGRDRATIWQNSEDRFTWHTWDVRGTGGENSECSSLRDAKEQCVAAIVRQGWAPGGWKVSW
jgi:hypothetical protein